MHLIIDRFEENIAVCQSFNEQTVEIEKTLLPKAAKEGDVLLCLEDGSFLIDMVKTSERKRILEERLKRLFKD